MSKTSILDRLGMLLGVPESEIVPHFVERARSLLREKRPPYCPYRVLHALRVPLVYREMLDEGFTARLVDLVSFDRTKSYATEQALVKRLTDNPFVVVLKRGHASPSGILRRRFTAAHELAHVLIRMRILKQDLEYVFPSDDPEEESLCNRIAAEFLIPRNELERDVRKVGMHCDSLNNLGRRKYSVSISCLLRATVGLFPNTRYAAGLYVWDPRDGCKIDYITPTPNRWIAHGTHAMDLSARAVESPGDQPCGRFLELTIGERRLNWYCESMRLGQSKWALVVFGDPSGAIFKTETIETRLRGAAENTPGELSWLEPSSDSDIERWRPWTVPTSKSPARAGRDMFAFRRRILAS